jgi:hypothetical protein
MARRYSKSSRRRSGRRLNGIILGLVAAVFVVIVFLMFRGGLHGPQEAVAQDETADAPAVEADRTAPQLAAVETNRPSENPTPLAVDTRPEPTVPVVQNRPEPAAVPVQTTPVIEPPAAVPNADVETIIAEGTALLQTRPRKVIAARDKLNEAMSLPMSARQRSLVKETMAQLSEEWLFGPAAFAGDHLCENYLVRPGDSLQVIGNKHKVPYETLMRINNIRRPKALQAGKTIKVPSGPFHAKVHRSTFTLDLYLQDTYVRSFKVGLGKAGYETPTGLWRVSHDGKLISPDWPDPDVPGRVLKAGDPEYPLGSRWIGLDGVSGAARDRTGFGIHGTKDPDEIGTAASRGCIRMYNGEAVLVYDCLFPLYSEVQVLD